MPEQLAFGSGAFQNRRMLMDEMLHTTGRTGARLPVLEPCAGSESRRRQPRARILIACSIALLAVLPASLQSQSFLGFGVGLHGNLGDLGGTIAKDGLNGNQEAPNLNGFSALGGGCAVSAPNCGQGVPGSRQQVVIPENALISSQKLSGNLIQVRAGGLMTGIVLDAFFEREFGALFLRAGLQHTRRIFGGHTTATVATISWYDIRWDFASHVVPFLVGIKTTAGEASGLYLAVGYSYYTGGWTLSGTNNGLLPRAFGLPLGAVDVVPSTATGGSGYRTCQAPTCATSGGPIIDEEAKFRKSGWGFNWLIGAELKLESGNKVFLEVDNLGAGGQATARVRTLAGASHLSQLPSYPVVIGGTRVRAGWKKAL